MSSDEEDMPDDADATDARKKARQGDDDFGEEMSDEEVDLAKVKGLVQLDPRLYSGWGFLPSQ